MTLGGRLLGSEVRPEIHCSYCNMFLIINLCSKITALCFTLSYISQFNVWQIQVYAFSKRRSNCCYFFPAWQNWAYLHIYFLLFLTGEMHADLHWECTSRKVLHLPDGRGSDSCAQIEPQCRKQSHERRPCAPLAYWWDFQENIATAALNTLFLIPLCHISGPGRLT